MRTPSSLIRRALLVAGLLPLLAGAFPRTARGDDPGDRTALEAGRPFLQSFGLRDYHAHNQNWAGAQDRRGVLYFGNKNVVLEYDGVSWRKLLITDTTYVRGLAYDPATDAVFVGGVDELGYLRADPDGGRTFVSLLDQLPAAARDFRDIRRVFAPTPGEIIFVAETRVMRWRDNRFTVWQPGSTGKLNAFVVDGRFYLHAPNLGLQRLEGDDFVPVAPGAGLLREDHVTILLPGATPGELLLGLAERGFWTLHVADGRTVPFPTGVDDFLRRHRLRRGQRLPDGTLALATMDAGLVWLGADGRFLGRLDEATGLPRDVILDLFTDREAGLWLGLSSGLARVELSGGTTIFDAHAGLRRTTLNDLARVNGTLFVAADSGLYRLVPAESGPAARPAHCERVAGGELWTVCPDGTGGVLAGTIDHLYQWHPDGRTTPLPGPVGQPRILRPSRTNPFRVWVGMREGLRSLRRDPATGAWRDEGPVPGLEGEEIRTVGEAADGAVWVGTPTRGVFRVTFAATTSPDGSRGPATVRRYFKTHGLPEGMQWTRIIPGRGGNDVLFATQTGLFRHDPAADHFEAVTEHGQRFGNGEFMLGNVAEDAAGDLWLAGRPPTGVWLDQELGRAPRGNLPWEPLSGRIPDRIGEIMALLPEVGPDGAGVVWIAGTDALARVVVGPRGGQRTADGGGSGGPAFGTNLRRISTTAGGGPSQPLPPGGATTPGNPHGPSLPAARNALRFEFAANTFRYGADVRYQTRLDGPDVPGNWSAPSPNTAVDYTNLAAGDYVFRVRGQDRDGGLGREAAWNFRVLPHWWRTAWAWAGYTGVGALAVAGLVRWRLGRVQRENAHLEARVARQTGELIHARDAAESANRAKSAFLANMSHELRTPLNAVLGYTQIMLKDRALSDKNRERLGVVGKSGEHLLGLINEVLDLSKIEAGKLAPDPADFPLGRLLDASAETFRPRAAEKGIRFTSRRGPDLPTVVHGDEGRLRQVLFNLLGNAVKFTARGGVEFRVDRAGSDDGQRIRFEVRDTGIGIPAAELDHIFLAFHQAHGPGAALAAEGTGLGLAISQRLVTLLGGELHVESTPAAGSRFWFELPLPEVSAAVATVSAAPVATASSVATGVSAVTGYHGPRRRVLVVDDEETNRHVLRELLAPLGFEVEEVSGGDGCLGRCARSPRPDIVLLDLRMGEPDGFTVARALRQRPEGAGLRIIAVSASVFEADQQQALDAGCDDFLPKPFAEAALVAALGRALNLHWISTASPPASAANGVNGGHHGENRHGDHRGPLPLPAAEVDALLELSRRGDVLKVRRRLADLLAADPRHARFIEPLEALAAGYQMNRLRDSLLELQRDESSGTP